MAEKNPTENHCELCNISIDLLFPVSLELKIFIREKINKDYDINKICEKCWRLVRSFQDDIHIRMSAYAIRNERNRDQCFLCCGPVLPNEPVSSSQSDFLSEKYQINLESSDKICNNCKDSLAEHMGRVTWWNMMMGGYKKAPTLEKTETSSAGSPSDSLKSSDHLNTPSPEAKTDIIVISSTSNSPTDCQ